MRKLHNSKSESYQDLKSLILSLKFPFFYNPNSFSSGTPAVEGHYDSPHWTHIVLRRPVANYPIPLVNSEYIGLFVDCFLGIAAENDIPVNSIMRINVNATYPAPLPTIPHDDHKFDHNVMIIYLTDAGGKTVCKTENSFHDPSEDDIILFSGTHYNFPPKEKRRVVIVYTFI